MNIQKENIDNDIFNKKIVLLNKLYFIITHTVFTYRNMDDLDNLINRFTDLSDSLKKPKDEEMLLRNIRKKGNIDTHRYSNKAK
jgi:hypothetical protein